MRQADILDDANSVLSFLQNIEDEDDAQDFVRISLDALEYMHEEIGTKFDRRKVRSMIKSVDKRV